MRLYRGAMKKLIMLFFAMFVATAQASELKIIVPGTNNSYFLNAQLLAPYLSKYLPEKPKIKFQSIPGAGSLIAANYLYNVAPKDGSTIGIVYKAIPLVGVLKPRNTKFDPEKFVWLGSTADGRKDAVIMWSNRSENYGDFMKKEIIVGAESQSSADSSMLIRDATGLKMKIISGYPSTGANRLAFERKEVDSVVYSLIGIKSRKPKWLKPESGIKALVQFGNGKVRHPEYPNVPTVFELTKDPKYIKILKVFESQFVLLRPFIAPPGVPAKRAAELREAFRKAVNDPGFKKTMSDRGIPLDPIYWEEAQKIALGVANSPKEILDIIRKRQNIK